MNGKELKTMNNKIQAVKSMYFLVTKMNDEFAFFDFTCTVPDGADEQDFIDIANDEELFNEACQSFIECINEYGKDGFYFD